MSKRLAITVASFAESTSRLQLERRLVLGRVLNSCQNEDFFGREIYTHLPRNEFNCEWDKSIYPFTTAEGRRWGWIFPPGLLAEMKLFLSNGLATGLVFLGVILTRQCKIGGCKREEPNILSGYVLFFLSFLSYRKIGT